jgi:uncharacterized damage-inducible protein DinB
VIDRDYVRLMARYNAWQNRAVAVVAERMPEEELTRDRGAFFGSIFATLNHLLWGDMMWMSRFCSDVPRPPGSGRDSVAMTPTIAAWSAERFRLDGRIRIWSETLRTIDLRGDLSWYSGVAGREVTRPVALCVVHMFNHQTHHRGQVHAMLTATGATLADTDLFLIPEDA